MTHAPLAFTVSPIERGGNNRANPDWIDRMMGDQRARAHLYWRGKPLMQGGRLSEVSAGALDWLPLDGEPVLLGEDSRGPVLAACLDPSIEEPDPGVEGAFEDARMTADGMDIDDAGIMAQGRALLEWRARHQFCSNCGAATRQAEGGAKRVCDSCETEHFPRVDPVAIVWITSGDKALLGRQGYWPEGIYSALAGFVEPGETLEAAARRETEEEAGVRLGAGAYVESQPWPFPSSMMIGVRAEAITETIEIDERELQDAAWFDRAEIAAALEGRGERLILPPSAAIARRLAERWIAGEW